MTLRNRFLALVIVLGAFLPFSQANAQTIIRDIELESAIKGWSTDLIRGAGLSPSAVNFIFIQDSEVNAFVAGGQNIFIHTGLIDRTDRLDELLGVVAHELGHISGGHLVRTKQALENASYEAILGTLIGVGAALAGGSPGAAGGAAAAAGSSAQRSFLSYSRVQESSADQAGLTYLRQANIDPYGLVSFMEKMGDQDLLPQTQQLEYVRTHPLSRNRLNAIEKRATESPAYRKGVPSQWNAEYDLIKAKLLAFVSPERVLWEYEDRDMSLPARYARTIADYRQNRIEKAVDGVNALIKENPNNPYFHELKGQMLSEFGQIKESLPSYRKAIEILPDAGLIRVAYAHALIESAGNNEGGLQEAIIQLKKAQLQEKRSTRLHRLMATAYGRLGNEGSAGLHLAEEALLQGRKDYAKSRVTGALNSLPKGSGDWYRAQDILNYLEQG